jgi:hypothetical protein
LSNFFEKEIELISMSTVQDILGARIPASAGPVGTTGKEQWGSATG